MRYGGAMQFLTEHTKPEEIDAPPELQQFDYGPHSSIAPLHFPINGASMLPAGEELLQVFAACELAILCQPGVNLQIEGHADQPHDEFSNKILSRNRAISAFNYLKNILGDDLRIPDLGDMPTEKEEANAARIAKKSGKSYSVAIPGSTRVKITAHGEPTDEAKDNKKPKPTYDIGWRRVDVQVCGVVAVSMRRREDSSTP